MSGIAFPVLCKYDHRTGNVQITDLQQCGILSSTSNSTSSTSSTGTVGIYNYENNIMTNSNTSSSSSSSDNNSKNSKKNSSTSGGNNSSTSGSSNGGNFLTQLRTHFHNVDDNNSTSSNNNTANKNITGRRMFVQLCLLAGCDYCDSIPSVGLQTALQVYIGRVCIVYV